MLAAVDAAKQQPLIQAYCNTNACTSPCICFHETHSCRCPPDANCAATALLRHRVLWEEGTLQPVPHSLPTGGYSRASHSTFLTGGSASHSMLCRIGLCYWSTDRACAWRHSKTRSLGVNSVMCGCRAATVARSADAASCTPSSVYFSSRITPCRATLGIAVVVS